MPAWHSDSSHFPRQACNHPYLFDYPVLPNSDELRVDEDLVRSSGKLQLLERYASGHPETIVRAGAYHITFVVTQLGRMAGCYRRSFATATRR